MFLVSQWLIGPYRQILSHCEDVWCFLTSHGVKLYCPINSIAGIFALD